jgi:hypothetical protein
MAREETDGAANYINQSRRRGAPAVADHLVCDFDKQASHALRRVVVPALRIYINQKYADARQTIAERARTITIQTLPPTPIGLTVQCRGSFESRSATRAASRLSRQASLCGHGVIDKGNYSNVLRVRAPTCAQRFDELFEGRQVLHVVLRKQACE